MSIIGQLDLTGEDTFQGHGVFAPGWDFPQNHLGGGLLTFGSVAIRVEIGL